MAKTKKKKSKNWIKKAVKHPGVEKARAKKSGRSTHAQLEHDAKSGDPTLEKRGELGLRFEGERGGIKGKKKTKKSGRKMTRRDGVRRTRRFGGKR